MGRHNAVRWLVAVIAILGIVALLAWRRNGPGVGGRFPDQSMGRVTMVIPVEDAAVGVI